MEILREENFDEIFPKIQFLDVFARLFASLLIEQLPSQNRPRNLFQDLGPFPSQIVRTFTEV